ncbi:MAG: UDP-N-acetylmuramoyl-tripeptide--D-alanyl-D-alanine ligase, partial [Phycisphaerales bacterium]|nr:UDP-N-acetylmuramoyl-tripeptide--D-alanyl-D-alanine ligase [Phycisphaerales bacterium]
GSNGKTTTGRLIDAVLRSRFRGTVSARSFNNDIGVPLTILAARPGDQYLVCEVGTNSPGEIETLARIIEPDIAIITMIGRAHIEHFGSTAAIAREKATLLSYIRPGGTAIVTAENDLLREFIKPIPNVLTFGRTRDADLRLTAFEHIADGDGGELSRFTINERRPFSLALYGEHNALNALAAVAVGHRFGLDDDEIARGLRDVVPSDMRLQRETIAGVDVFNDAYNASPESTVAAIRTFAALTGASRRRIVVVGDMLELGDAAPGAHREVAQAILEAEGIDAVVTVGAAALYTADELSQHWPQGRISMFQRLRDDEARRIATMFEDGDAVLIKGSRGMRLEQIIVALRERVPSGPGV